MDTREGVATTICLYFVSDEGESAIVWHVDDDVAVTPENVRAAAPAFEAADAVLMTFEMPAPFIRETIRAARRGGARLADLERQPGEARQCRERIGGSLPGVSWSRKR